MFSSERNYSLYAVSIDPLPLYLSNTRQSLYQNQLMNKFIPGPSSMAPLRNPAHNIHRPLQQQVRQPKAPKPKQIN